MSKSLEATIQRVTMESARHLTRMDMYNIFDYKADDTDLRRFIADISPETESAWRIVAAMALNEMFEDDIETWLDVVEGLELSANREEEENECSM